MPLIQNSQPGYFLCNGHFGPACNLGRHPTPHPPDLSLAMYSTEAEQLSVNLICPSLCSVGYFAPDHVSLGPNGWKALSGVLPNTFCRVASMTPTGPGLGLASSAPMGKPPMGPQKRPNRVVRRYSQTSNRSRVRTLFKMMRVWPEMDWRSQGPSFACPDRGRPQFPQAKRSMVIPYCFFLKEQQKVLRQ